MNLVGQQIGSWKILKKIGVLKNRGTHNFYRCQCRCGNQQEVPWELLKPHQPADTVKWVEETIAEWAKWDKEEAEREANDFATTTSGDSNPGGDSNQSEVPSESGRDNQSV